MKGLKEFIKSLKGCGTKLKGNPCIGPFGATPCGGFWADGGFWTGGGFWAVCGPCGGASGDGMQWLISYSTI